jgi:diguanylate cyclase (GGDEF)-like protein
MPAGIDARTSLPDRYRVLLEIGHSLSGTLSLDELYRTIYKETSSVLEADGFFISLYEPETDLATVVFYADRGQEQRAEITYRGSESPVMSEGEPVLVADRLRARSLLVLGDESHGVTRSAISAPLRRGRVMGAISAQSYRPGAYTQVELELLQGIADLAAVAVENAHYVAELERQTREAEQIERIGRALASSLDPQEVLGKVVDAVVDLMEADGAAVLLLESGPRMRVAAAAGDGVPPAGASWNPGDTPLADLVSDGGPVTVTDRSLSPLFPPLPERPPEVGVAAAVPLWGSHRVAGALLATRRAPRTGTGVEVRVLERLASQASVALENARLHASVQSLSLTDPLTGLPNRRHLHMHLEREIAAARRGRPLAVVLFDLDNFKGYNDTLGHLAGDEALRVFADILSTENRAMNLVARYGGDEFISVLGDASVAGASRYVRRVRDRVARDPLLSPHGVSVSSGMAHFDPRTMDNALDLVQAADTDLYAGKNGRQPSPPREDGG